MMVPDCLDPLFFAPVSFFPKRTHARRRRGWTRRRGAIAVVTIVDEQGQKNLVRNFFPKSLISFSLWGEGEFFSSAGGWQTASSPSAETETINRRRVVA